MARYSLFMLKVPLNSNKPNQTSITDTISQYLKLQRILEFAGHQLVFIIP